MTASERLKALIQGGAAYVERGELGNENVVPANRLMDALMDARYELLAVVEAAEWLGLEVNPNDKPRHPSISAALAALDEKLGGDVT